MDLDTTRPGQRIANYEVISHLGRGGMGTVVQVREVATDQRYALKVLPRVDDALRQRLLREGRLQGRLDHPGIVPVVDVLDIDGHPGLVLELVPGGRTLADRIAEGGLDDAEVHRLADALFDAVEAAHAIGLVHRDLKPANILMHDGHPRIADFGLAKAMGELGSVATATGALLGTPAYMAPEQVQDAKSVDARADLFSLGAVLYELIAGRRAFPGAPTEAMWKAAREEAEPLPPGPRWDAVAWALHSHPDDRAPTVADLREVWHGRRAAPENDHATWQVASLAACPPIEALVERRDDPTTEDHLAGCVRCRVELRLYDDAFATPPAPPKAASWPVGAWALGFFGGGLGALATTVAVMGSLDELAKVGPFLLLLLLVPALTGARLAHAVHRARNDVATTLLGWYLGPALVLAVGAVATALGADQVLGALARATSHGRDELLRLASLGSHVALSTWTIGSAIGAVSMLLPPVALVVIARDRVRDAGFDQLPVVVGLGGAALLWLGEGGTPAGLLAFVATTAVGLLLALLPRTVPVAMRGPVAVGAVVVVATTPVAARVELLRRAVVDDPTTSSWGTVVDGWSLGWLALAVVLGLVAWRPPPGESPAWPAPSTLAQLVLLAAIGAVPTAWTVAQMAALGDAMTRYAP